MRGDMLRKVYLEWDDFGHDLKILVCTELDGGQLLKLMDGAGEWHEYDANAPIKPTLRLPRPIADALIKSVLEMANEKGLKTDSEARISGKLEATKYHLEDLRALLKLRRQS